MKSGKGIIDSLINSTPVELHIPGYQYCGPGTKLDKRLKRGDPGINKLDSACREHDIVYSKHKSGIERYNADKKLSENAWNRVKSSDASFGERLTALGVTAAMKAKMALSKTGGRLRKFGREQRKKKTVKKKKSSDSKKQKKTFKHMISNLKKVLKNKKVTPSTINAAIRSAKSYKRQNNILFPRVIPIPKTGGVLPLIPIFAGLSALGALSGGVSAIIKNIKDINSGREVLDETKRHNHRMEDISIGKTGSGLYLKPYKKGYGLYLKPYPKNY